MKKKKSTLKNLKKEVGGRIKVFRLDKKKAQNVLASELQVHQSTITNIEHGTTFPKVNYLHYFYEKYGLNLNWLVTGVGEKYMNGAKKKIPKKINAPHHEYDDLRYDKYQELNLMMQIPVIEQVMFAKLSECKILFQDHVREFHEQLEEEIREKKRKASQVKVKK